MEFNGKEDRKEYLKYKTYENIFQLRKDLISIGDFKIKNDKMEKKYRKEIVDYILYNLTYKDNLGCGQLSDVNIESKDYDKVLNLISINIVYFCYVFEIFRERVEKKFSSIMDIIFYKWNNTYIFKSREKENIYKIRYNDIFFNLIASLLYNSQ